MAAVIATRSPPGNFVSVTLARLLRACELLAAGQARLGGERREVVEEAQLSCHEVGAPSFTEARDGVGESVGIDVAAGAEPHLFLLAQALRQLIQAAEGEQLRVPVRDAARRVDGQALLLFAVAAGFIIVLEAKAERIELLVAAGAYGARRHVLFLVALARGFDAGGCVDERGHTCRNLRALPAQETL